MILVDTTVWIDHLRSTDPALGRLLETGQVLMHPMVLGELVCGNFANRAERVRSWRGLPFIHASEHDDVIDWIEDQRLFGRGIGFVDAHLLRAVLTHGDATLWTRDQSLRTLAARFDAAYADNHS